MMRSMTIVMMVIANWPGPLSLLGAELAGLGPWGGVEVVPGVYRHKIVKY